MATRSQFRKRVMLILFALWTGPALGLILFFALADQRGHPPATFGAAIVGFILLVGAALMFFVWAIMGLKDR